MLLKSIPSFVIRTYSAEDILSLLGAMFALPPSALPLCSTRKRPLPRWLSPAQSHSLGFCVPLHNGAFSMELT